jgi:hypothetical protein
MLVINTYKKHYYQTIKIKLKFNKYMNNALEIFKNRYNKKRYWQMIKKKEHERETFLLVFLITKIIHKIKLLHINLFFPFLSIKTYFFGRFVYFKI